ncbi:MAG: hypothetical protein IKE55_06090 [Kiritimatiellae bacterium]|nr:hypothetical protein [Kiritimatiellia bacterium]
MKDKVDRRLAALHGLAVAAALCASVAAAQERAAVVYCEWDGCAFSTEYDAHLKKLGWAFDKYENVRLPELTEKLGAYRLVVAASLANYTKTVKMAPFAAAWRKWLAEGGALVVTDANYASVLNDWVAEFGPGFESGCALCSSHTKPSEATRAVAVRPDPLLLCPKPLGALLQKHYVQWAHLTRLGPDWRTPIVCVDGAPVFAYRRVGKGLVVLASAASLRNSPIASALLENVAAYLRLREKGIEVVSFEQNLPGADPAERVCRLRLKVAPGCGRRVKATLASRNAGAKGTAEAEGADEAVVPANGEVVLAPACAIVWSGTTSSRLEVSVDGRSVLSCEWEATSPETIALRLKQKHLYPGDSLVPLIAVNPPAEGRAQLSGIAWRIDGGEWRVREAKDGTWAVPVSGLAVGRHVMEARLRYRDGFLESMEAARRSLFDWGESAEAQFFTHPEPKYRVRGDHVILENGKPFFPIGFYQVAWSVPAEECLRMVRNIASWGYNTVHVPCKGDSHGALLDECARLGVRVITEFAGDPGPVIEKYRGKPAVLGWNPGDEPSSRGVTPEQMFARYDRFKQLDHDHVAYTVICSPSQYGRYASGTDVLAPDPYPVPRRQIDDVYRRFREAAAEISGNNALWAVGQAFGGQRYAKNGEWSRCPDAREFRGMTYLSLMAGAKGVVYYTYSDGAFDIFKAPGLLEAAKAFPVELRELAPFVLDGKCELLAEDADGAYATAWTLGAERRLVVVNARNKETRVSLPFAAGQVLRGEPRDMRTEGGRVSFAIPPLERVVIRGAQALALRRR